MHLVQNSTVFVITLEKKIYWLRAQLRMHRIFYFFVVRSMTASNRNI